MSGTAGGEGNWQSIETVPRDGTQFFALNHDGEIWRCKYDEYGRLAYRTNHRMERKKWRLHDCDGVEHRELIEENESWQSAWTFWSRMYEFRPTHWVKIPQLPATQRTTERGRG